MASTVRIPAELEADARSRCERLGISFNALVCVALDAYLRGPGLADGAGADAQGVNQAPAIDAPALAAVPTSSGAPLSRKERRRLAAAARGGR